MVIRQIARNIMFLQRTKPKIDPKKGYALSASNLEQEGTIFTFIQRQNYVACDYVGSQTMSWDIEHSLMCKCGFSILQPFDRRGAFEFNFKTGTADLIGFFPMIRMQQMD
jgi:hypothetical protein